MIKELVLGTYRPQLVIFLAEQKLESAEEIADAADHYDETRSRPLTVV